MTAAALVAAGLLSVILFPLIALAVAQTTLRRLAPPIENLAERTTPRPSPAQLNPGQSPPSAYLAGF